MQFTDRQRTTIHAVDALLNRLGCEIVIGPAPETVDALRAGYVEVASHLRALEVPELTALAESITDRARVVDADRFAKLHAFVQDAWVAWSTKAGLAVEGGIDTPVPTLVAPSPAADDQDLVVLASDPEMTSMFVAEALDHLGTIEATILELETAPQDKRLLDDVFRPFHTIKGLSLIHI